MGKHLLLDIHVYLASSGSLQRAIDHIPHGNGCNCNLLRPNHCANPSNDEQQIVSYKTRNTHPDRWVFFFKNIAPKQSNDA